METQIAQNEVEARAIQIVRVAPKTISELLADGKFYDWQSEEISSGGWSRKSDSRDRFNRCYEAAEDGGDGSTHAEHIDDFRSYGKEIYRGLNSELFRCFGEGMDETKEDQLQDNLDAAQAEFESDCDRCEQWHEKKRLFESASRLIW